MMGANLDCEYEEGSIYGAIEVVVTRVEMSKYKLTYVIRELRWK
jgi:hypothetical protein